MSITQLVATTLQTLPLMALAGGLLVVGALVVAWPMVAGIGERSDMKRRLKVAPPGEVVESGKRPDGGAELRQRAVRKAQEFYSRADAENVARIRLKLIQAGYFDPGAVGAFFVLRFAAFAALALGTFMMVRLFGSSDGGATAWMFVVVAGGFGYFLPSMALASQVRTRKREYRNGFPDFMDLMIVCSDAGMSMEAAIDRVSREIAATYPTLSQNLQLVSIELRAGRSLDDALKSLGDRLSLDEVRSFATLLQQSKELGTSLAGALRVFSDEMRHKRIMAAEEKAHALPAKMSVPVTVCILPVILLIAVIPIIVKFAG